MNNFLRTKLIPSTLLALTLCCYWGSTSPASAQLGIEGTNAMARTDFEFSTPWGYGYFYYWGWPDGQQFTSGTYAYDYAFNDPLKSEEPIVGAYYFTNTTLLDLMTNSGAGYGTGFGGPMIAVDYGFGILSTNLEDYIFSFEARAEGLAPDQTTANGEMQAQWQAGGNILQHNFNVAVSSNWTRYTFLLSEADGLGGNPGTISNWVFAVENYMIFGMNWNFNFHQPDGRFGFDEDNVVYVDNLRLDLIVKTGTPPVLPPTELVTVLDWNMDDKPLFFTYGGYNWSQNNYLPLFTYPANAEAMDGYGVDGSRGWWLRMDNSQLAPPNTPQWAGGGTGGGGAVDLARFDTGDLARYKLTFDAKAEGLNEFTETTTCRMQLFLDSPGNNMRLDFNIPCGTNWTTTSYLLNQGSVGFGSKATFLTNPVVTGVRIQNQIENAPSEASWSYDADNVLVVDNIKLERIYDACPPLSIVTIGSNEVISWAQPSTGTAKLQSANAITGPWNDVVGATSPYTNAIANAPKFYRTIWVPPAP